MVFKLTGFNAKIGFENYASSWNIGQNVSNFAGLVWKADFGQFFGNILGLGAYFLKPIFALKPWVQVGWFEYHEPYNLIIFVKYIAQLYNMHMSTHGIYTD